MTDVKGIWIKTNEGDMNMDTQGKTDEQLENEVCEYAFKLAYETKSIMDDPQARKDAIHAMELIRKKMDTNIGNPIYFVRGPVSAHMAMAYLQSNANASQGDLDQYLANNLKRGSSKATPDGTVYSFGSGTSGNLKIDYDAHLWTYWVHHFRYGLNRYYPEEWKNFPDLEEFIVNILDKNALHGVINDDKRAILIDRPAKLHLDQDGNLHNPDGPAIVYRDGSCQCFLNGEKIPFWVFESPKSEVDMKRVMI